MAEQSVTFPPVVYVPTAPGEDGQSRLELAQLDDGRIALFAYSAMDRLAEFYRTDAPGCCSRSRICSGCTSNPLTT